MVRSLVLGLAVLALASGAAFAPDTAVAADAPREPRERVDHHLKEVARLVQHFEGVLAQECPHFASRREWSAYLDREIDQLVLLLAHKEEAWAEARQTGDDELRRHAKMPREQRDHARVLAEKFQTCAEGNGASFSPPSLWRRIERDVPRRRAAIALPSP